MIYKICLGDLQENCYVISNDNKTCILIDPGDDYDKLINFIKEKKLEIKAILLTHGHFDHCASCKKLQLKGVKVYIHKLDSLKVSNFGNLSDIFGYNFEKFDADIKFDLDNEYINIDNYKFKVIHTPGHTSGSVCYIYENNIFCGDTIFENGIGRTDLYDGSFIKLNNSIKKLQPYLNGNYNLFYGH